MSAEPGKGDRRRRAGPQRYFYHLTDGRNLLVDGEGCQQRSSRQVRKEALRKARQMMSDAPGEIDWSGWLVCVQDQKGYSVARLPFPS